MHGMRGSTDPAREPPVIVIGGGGHAGRLIHFLQLLKRQVLFVTDSNPQARGTRIEGVEVRGDDEAIFEHPPDVVEIVNGIGSANIPKIRRKVFVRFREEGYRFASVVHPSAVIASSAMLGEGVQVMAGAVIDHNVVVGNNSLVNTRTSISHDCVIGEHVHVASGATVCGNVGLGNMTLVGAGATIIQGVQVGERALIGAGSLVLGAVEDGTVVLGVPARPRGDPLTNEKTCDT